MKTSVYTHVVGLFTFPKPVTIFKQMLLSEQFLIYQRRRKQLNHDT